MVATNWMVARWAAGLGPAVMLVAEGAGLTVTVSGLEVADPKWAMKVLWPDGCAAMYRREMLDEIGGFDEDFFAYADDAELGLRARIAGWKCIYIPLAVVRHHRGATLGVRSSRRLELIERNRVLLAAKLFPWGLLWMNPLYYAMRLGAGVWAAITGEGEVGKYPGWSGKLKAAFALLKGDWQAMPLLPRM